MTARDVSHRRPAHSGPRRAAALRRPAAIAVALLLAAGAAACSSDSDSTATGGTTGGTTGTTNPAFNDPTDPFYVAPDPLPDGKPGDVIRSEKLDGAPSGSEAWRVLYLSTGVDEKPTAVSGVVIAPTGTTEGSTPGSTAGSVPTTDRPILSWAHPTTGVVDDCAPSTMSDVFALIPGLDSFIEAGYVVAATDYESLGTEGVHPYLIGDSEGRSVLDAARAARNMDETHSGDELLLWGHSQGGQASLFAGQLAPSYAPELKLLATAAAAPAGELQELLNDDSGTTEGVVLGAYAVNAYVDIYAEQYPDISESQVITAEGIPAIAELVKLCDLTQSDQMDAIAKPLTGTFYVDDPGSVEPWKTLLSKNTAGGTKIEGPVFVAQGTADTIVVPSTTQQLVQTYCDNGTDISLKLYDGITHDLIGYESAGDVASFFAEVLGGSTPTSTCS